MAGKVRFKYTVTNTHISQTVILRHENAKYYKLKLVQYGGYVLTSFVHFINTMNIFSSFFVYVLIVLFVGRCKILFFYLMKKAIWLKPPT
jgi:hypothetical protein